jgi:intracellular sulfur oxidation DsrE/DsrF family protein
MKTRNVTIVLTLFSFIILCLAAPTQSPAEGYTSLKGVNSVKILFDFRDGNLKSAPVHLKLIYETYKDKALTAITGKPKFVVVFMGNAVKLLSTSRKGVSAEEAKVRDEIAGLIAAMSKAGVKFEACLFAVKFFGGDPKDLVQGVDHVPNGWISAFGYQANGYALIPAY